MTVVASPMTSLAKPMLILDLTLHLDLSGNQELAGLGDFDMIIAHWTSTKDKIGFDSARWRKKF